MEQIRNEVETKTMYTMAQSQETLSTHRDGNAHMLKKKYPFKRLDRMPFLLSWTWWHTPLTPTFFALETSLDYRASFKQPELYSETLLRKHHQPQKRL